MSTPERPDLLRIDCALVERGLVESRARARELLDRGAVRLAGQIVRRASTRVGRADPIAVAEPLRFVSRGGDKLDAALDTLGVDVSGLGCLDVGASTGGFTDCLLSRGARAVCAVDVGRDQLAPRLREDPRVLVLDGTNARELCRSALPFRPEVVVVDASFISLAALAPALASLLDEGGTLVALVKPQFEVGPGEARRRRGVIPRGPARDAAVARAREALTSAGLEILGEADSVVPGPKGNVERFLYARRRSP